MKVTERMLVDMCRRINSDQLRCWDSGLKVERRGDGYVVLRQFRRPQQGRPGSFDLYRGSSREVKSFIDGFAYAAELVDKVPSAIEVAKV